MTLVSPVPSRRRKAKRAPRIEEVLIPRQGDRCFVGPAEVPLGMSPGSVQQHNQALREILEEIGREVRKTGSIELDRLFSDKVMQNLRGIGSSAYSRLGKDFTRVFNNLEQEAGEAGLALNIKSDTFPLLWEMLYTGSSRGEAQAEEFCGFRHRIARYQLGTSIYDKPKKEEIDANCDFLFCHHEQLSHWQEELDRIKRQVSQRFRFHLLGDVLPKLCGVTTTCYLSEHFIDVLAAPELELELLHLACHCLPDPHQAGVLFSQLVLSGQSWQVSIKLHELQSAQREFKFSLQPLVFLNACKTMTNPDLLSQGDSFPSGFLGFGASGVIATACNVHDLFAAEFATKFYKNLFVDVGGRSPTVSEALLKTRQFFIEPPYYNPLGLAYGLYARSDLHIEWEPWANEEEGMANEDD